MASFFKRLARPFTPTKPKHVSEEKVHLEDPAPNDSLPAEGSQGSPTIPPFIPATEEHPPQEYFSPTISPPRGSEATMYRSRRRVGNRTLNLPLFRIVSDPHQSSHEEPNSGSRICGGLLSPRDRNLPETNRFEPLLDHFRIIGPLLHATPTSMIYSVVKRSTLQVNTARIFKKISSYETNLDYRRRLQNEILIATRLEHPNIMKLHDVCIHSDLHFVITDGGFYDGHGLLGKSLPNEEAHSMLWDLIEGLDYLHSVGVAHLDLKLENLAIYHEGTLKICNFGKACSKDSPPPGLYLDHNNAYSSPELVSHRPHVTDLFPCDIWAAGVLGYVFLTGRFPWKLADPTDPGYCWFVTSQEFCYPPPNLWSELLLLMLSADVYSRSTAREALFEIRAFPPIRASLTSLESVSI